MSENNRPDSEQKKDQTTAEDILAQVDSILADLENSAVAQLFAAPEKPKPEENKKPPEKEESAPDIPAEGMKKAPMTRFKSRNRGYIRNERGFDKLRHRVYNIYKKE